MGGIVVILDGDFRQTLPVIERGTSAGEINARHKASQLWSNVERLSLTCNMWVNFYNDQNSGFYASKPLQIGEGRQRPT